MPTTAALNTLPEPDAFATAHSARLLAHIRAEIAKTGAISFHRFMDLALYAPALGYYRAGTRKFGAGGDFITAPELSPLFSRCLARQCGEILDTLDDGTILEIGAGTGIMAAGILRELQNCDMLPNYYDILEISGELRQRQQQTLREHVPDLLARVNWLDTLPSSNFQGVILGNEVLDALPVERFRITATGCRRLEVIDTGDQLDWREGENDPAVTAAVARIQADLDAPLPEAYTSEYIPDLDTWLRSVTESLTAGAVLFIDYGYPRREYYLPERTTGTLRCHYRHRAHDNPLILTGLQDITAHVDFTALADAAVSAGLTVAGYTSQNHFLFGCGLMELLNEVDPNDTVRYLEQAGQVKLLTLPGEMGSRFQVMALTRHLHQPLCGFSCRDECGRL